MRLLWCEDRGRLDVFPLLSSPGGLMGRACLPALHGSCQVILTNLLLEIPPRTSNKSVRVKTCCNLSQLFLPTLYLPLLSRRSLTASATFSASCDSPSLFCLICLVKSKAPNCATRCLRLLEILQP